MENNNSSSLKVIILDSEMKMQTIDDAIMIRIKSKTFNLLIMKDYWPIIGEIDGNVSIDGESNNTFKNIKGFFSMSHNIFYLIIKEKGINNG